MFKKKKEHHSQKQTSEEGSSKYTIIIILLIIGLVIIPFAGEIKAVLEAFVEVTGLWGLAVVVFFLDIIFIQPLSPTIYLIIGILGGLNWALAFVIAAGASWLAGVVGFGLGRYVGIDFMNKFVNRQKLHQAQSIFRKHSSFVIILGAMSPVPYSITCWVAGMSEMKFTRFMLDSFIARFLGFFIVAISSKLGFSLIPFL